MWANDGWEEFEKIVEILTDHSNLTEIDFYNMAKDYYDEMCGDPYQNCGYEIMYDTYDANPSDNPLV